VSLSTDFCKPHWWSSWKAFHVWEEHHCLRCGRRDEFAQAVARDSPRTEERWVELFGRVANGEAMPTEWLEFDMWVDDGLNEEHRRSYPWFLRWLVK
jgi:hypothetical protein